MTATATQVELLDACRTYIALLNELLDRGNALKKALDADEFTGRSVVVMNCGSFYEVAKSYSGTLPVSVRPVTVFGLTDEE